ncbi:GMC family oxidoreductase N-terminal domain-containing protein [Actinoplanes sp. TRM88002]|uniref:GMC family oxidoreductase N-terminal domain-containing protein n=1 Tax=Paractinoplanes hotanensis TaxID=2906497 RepID=A0ABT0YBM2_9ACTN|nr:GMC family oxidoreductase N-terminal domain-containing protein [Actinoplanes hotanensis]
METVVANGPRHDGASQTMVTQRRGARFSAVDGYLKAARRRKNLVVRMGAHTTRVLFDGTRAIGVEYVREVTLFAAERPAQLAVNTTGFETPPCSTQEMRKPSAVAARTSPACGPVTRSLIDDVRRSTSAERHHEVSGLS